MPLIMSGACVTYKILNNVTVFIIPESTAKVLLQLKLALVNIVKLRRPLCSVSVGNK